MSRIEIILRATVNLEDFESKDISQLQDLIEDSNFINLEIEDCTGETFSAELEFVSVKEE